MRSPLSREDVLHRVEEVPVSGRRRSNEEAESELPPFENRNPWIRGDRPLKSAAVLVPIVDRPEGLTLLLTKRTDHLDKHPGQISFPGGRVDETDRNAEHTALRETEEEIGLKPELFELIGRLDDFIVGTGFLVTPVMGIIDPPFELDPHDHEVAEIFEAPLDYLIDPNNFEVHQREFYGSMMSYFAVTWNDFFIWGATAGMIRVLSERLLGLSDGSAPRIDPDLRT